MSDLNHDQKFNKYSLIGLCVMIGLPFVVHLIPTSHSSYFQVFDQVSLPLWGALYAGFWIFYHKRIKKLDATIARLKATELGYSTQGMKIVQAHRDKTTQLKEMEYDLQVSKMNYDFINVALRFSLIIAALVKLIQFISTLIR